VSLNINFYETGFFYHITFWCSQTHRWSYFSHGFLASCFWDFLL